MGGSDPAAPLASVVRIGRPLSQRLSIFPLAGAILFPGLQLPLHVFEPRYRELIGSALAKDRLIGIIQPQKPSDRAPLYTVGCVGRIGDVEALEDGRYNIVLDGESRFRVLRELEVATAFRQVEAEMIEDPSGQTLSTVERAGFEFEARRFADMQGYSVDWDSVDQLDDETICSPCEQSTQCGNSCGRCELCLGRTLEDLPEDCFQPNEPADMGSPQGDMGTAAGDMGTPDDPDMGTPPPTPFTCDGEFEPCDANGQCNQGINYYCIQGCCIEYAG